MTLTAHEAPWQAPEPSGRAAALPRRALLRPGWPLTALIVLYPLWWALGMGTLIVFVLAVPMAVGLMVRRPVRVPPGFGLWLLFVAWVLLSTTMLRLNPPGTVAETVGHRVLPVAFNVAGYLAATVVLLYAGNLTEEEFPRARMVRQLGWLFIVVVAGGLLGTFAPTFQFTSPVERLLPVNISTNIFVQSLVHPAAAQLQDVLGYTAPRPSAPFGYTNTWGNCLALLLGWFVISWVSKQKPWRRAVGLLILAAAAIPVVYSLNRGLWVGLGLAVLVVGARQAARGHFAVLTGIFASLLVLGAVVAFSPLAGIVEARLANPESNNIRTFTTEKTLEVLPYSPVLGFGSTRAALGSSNSIVVGQDNTCQRCGNPTLGSNGQLWLLLVAQGIVGALLYVGFFLRSLWAYRHDRTPIGDAGIVCLVLPFWFMFVYNALTMPLIISMLGIALLWRNARETAAAAAPIADAEPAGRLPWAGSARPGGPR